MEALLEHLKGRLGLGVEATAEEVLSLAAQRLDAIPALIEVAGLLGLPENASASQIKGAVLALKGGTEQFCSLQQELAAMKTR